MKVFTAPEGDPGNWRFYGREAFNAECKRVAREAEAEGRQLAVVAVRRLAVRNLRARYLAGKEKARA